MVSPGSGIGGRFSAIRTRLAWARTRWYKESITYLYLYFLSFLYKYKYNTCIYININIYVYIYIYIYIYIHIYSYTCTSVTSRVPLLPASSKAKVANTNRSGFKYDERYTRSAPRVCKPSQPSSRYSRRAGWRTLYSDVIVAGLVTSS